MEELPPDPLLRPGTFIDPTTNDGYHHSDSSAPIHSSSSAGTPHGNPINAESEVPDWLPPGWKVEFRVRSSGATAGHRDKYYYHPSTTRRFRSKKEVLNFLETGESGSKKKKLDGPDAENTPPSSKRKKAAPKVSVENFNFNDVPGKVKWVMTDVYEDSWSPLVGGIDRVPEYSKQEWAAAFRYVSLQKDGNATPYLL